MKTKAEAVKALQSAVELRALADELMEEHGISKMLTEADDLKRKATKFCASKGIDKLDLPNGRYGKLIQAVQERIWVGTKADIPAEAEQNVKPLKSLVSKEIWMKLTKRVPDPERIEKAVEEGVVTLDEIAPCYVERMRAPFIRVFEGGDNGKA